MRHFILTSEVEVPQRFINVSRFQELAKFKSQIYYHGHSQAKNEIFYWDRYMQFEVFSFGEVSLELSWDQSYTHLSGRSISIKNIVVYTGLWCFLPFPQKLKYILQNSEMNGIKNGENQIRSGQYGQRFRTHRWPSLYDGKKSGFTYF